MSDTPTRNLRGSLPSRSVRLTDLEREALKSQGLLDAKGVPTEEAVAKPMPDPVNPNIAQPVPLSMTDPKRAAEIEAEIARVREQARREAGAPAVDSKETYFKPPTSQETPSAPAAESAAAPPVDKEAGLDTFKAVTRCPFCLYDLVKKFDDITVTVEDKRAFIRHIMAKTEGRFHKTYPLFDGEVVVTFRSQTTAERDAIMTRLGKWVKDNGDATQLELDAIMLKLNMSSSLVKVTQIGGEEIEFPTVQEGITKGLYNSEDPYMSCADYVFAPGRCEAWFSVMYGQYLEFKKFYDLLTMRAARPDFWKAIAGPV